MAFHYKAFIALAVLGTIPSILPKWMPHSFQGTEYLRRARRANPPNFARKGSNELHVMPKVITTNSKTEAVAVCYMVPAATTVPFDVSRLSVDPS